MQNTHVFHLWYPKFYGSWCVSSSVGFRVTTLILSQFIKTKWLYMVKYTAMRIFINMRFTFLILNPLLCDLRYLNPNIILFEEGLWLDRITSNFYFPLLNLLKMLCKSFTSIFIETQVLQKLAWFLKLVISSFNVSLVFSKYSI